MSILSSYQDAEIFAHHSLDTFENVLPASDAFPIHAHERAEIYVFLSGSVSYLVEGTVYDLAPGDLLVLRPAEAHKPEISPGRPYERLSFHFPLRLFDSFDPEHTLHRPFMDRPLGQHNLYNKDLLPHLPLLAECLDQPPLDRLRILSYLFVLLTDISRQFDRTPLRTTTPDLISQQLVSYVNLHLYEEISIPAIASAIDRSPSHIERLFRQATGTSLWEYVNIKRLLSARAMLSRGERAQHVSEVCGFSDYSSFFRAYKKYFGHPPLQDRGRETKGLKKSPARAQNKASEA